MRVGHRFDSFRVWRLGNAVLVVLLFVVMPILAQPDCPDDPVELFFPWISNRDNRFLSRLIVDNLNDQAVKLVLNARRADGSSQRVTRTIPAKGMLSETAAELFNQLGSGDGYSVLIQAPLGAVYGRWITSSTATASGASPAQGVALRYRQDRRDIDTRTSSDLIFSYLPLGNDLISAVVVSQLGTVATNLRLQVFSRTGQLLNEHQVESLEPGRPYAALVDDLVTGNPQDVWIRALAQGTPLSGVSFVFHREFLEPAIGNAVPVPAAGSTAGDLIFPWISNRVDEFLSRIVINNYGSESARLVLTARRGDGSDPLTVEHTLAPKAALVSSAAELFSGLGSGNGYTVQLSSDRSTVTGSWVTANLRASSGFSPSFGVAQRVPSAVDAQGNTLLFGYLPENQAVVAAPVVVNVGSQPTQVSVELTDVQGTGILAQSLSQVTLAPRRPWVVPTEFLGNDTGRDRYLRVTSPDQPLRGTAFVFDGRFLEPAIGAATVLDPPVTLISNPTGPHFSDSTASSFNFGSILGATMDAHAGDLDGDGDLDVVIAREFATNRFLFNNGNGTFTDTTEARLGFPLLVHDSEDVGIADLDGDGDQDVVFVSEDDQTNEMYFNEGSGTFTNESGRFPISRVSNALIIADINEDGAPDLLIGNRGGNSILINDGRGFFMDDSARRLPDQSLSATTQDLELGDVDGDGDLDLVVANEGLNHLLINDGSGVFFDQSAGRIPYRAGREETREADFGDVDGDGDLDILFANITLAPGATNNWNRLLINDGNGFFTDESSSRLPRDSDSSLDGDFIDIDQDCDLDIVTANVQVRNGAIRPQFYRVYRNDGNGRFSLASSQVFGSEISGNGFDIEAADFNGDGFKDLYFSSRGGSDRILMRTPSSKR